MTNLYTLTSDLHNEVTDDVLNEDFIREYCASTGVQFILKGADFSDYGTSGDDVIYVRTGGTEGIFKSVFCGSGKPAIPGEKPVRLLTSGKSNSLAASMEILSYLNMHGIKGEIIHGSGVCRGGADPVRPLRGKGALQGKRFGVVGKPSDWLISSDVDYANAAAVLGAELVDIPIEELIDLYGKGGYTSPLPLARLNAPRYGKSISEEEMQKAVNVYGALATIAGKYHLNGLTLRCFDLLGTIGTTGCLALAILNSRGIVATCEGDVPAMLSMALAQVVSGTPGFQVNLSKIEGDEFLFAHCTVPLDIVKHYCYDTHFESGIGVAIHGEFETGPATLLKVNARLDSFIAKDVEIVANRYGDSLCRTQIIVKAENLAEYMLTSPLGNHHVIVPGHHEAQIKELLGL